jgi:outer membrane lipoprotein SlyB
MKCEAAILTLSMLLPIGTALQAAQPAQTYMAPAGQTSQVREVVYRRRPRRRVIVRRRPFGHSAAIVGGSAAGGAAIGALAGGGKGALIGGLVGGTGGLIYDRATHKKRVVVRR